MFATLATRGSVIAFEPHPKACAQFERNLALNPGLGSRIALLRLSLGRQPADGHALASAGGQSTVCALDTLVTSGNVAPPGFVKIDVDGAEVEVLLGMAGVTERAKPIVLVETHGLKLEQDCLTLLAERGYQTTIIKNAGWRTLYPEPRPSVHNRWLLARPQLSAMRGCMQRVSLEFRVSDIQHERSCAAARAQRCGPRRPQCRGAARLHRGFL